MKILVKRSRAFGDVLLATAVLPYLHKKHPEDEIYFATRTPILLEENPYVTKVIDSKNIIGSYDLTYDLDYAYENHPELSILGAYARIVGCDPAELELELKIPESKQIMADQIMEGKGLTSAKFIIALQTSAGFWVKNWRPQSFEALIAYLRDLYSIKFILLGGKDDPMIRGAEDLRGVGDIMVSAAILQKCKAFIGLDSSLLHFAKAFKMPVAAFFGSTDPNKRIKIEAGDLAVVSDIACRFCHDRQKPPALITICEIEKPFMKFVDTIFQKVSLQAEKGSFTNKVIRRMLERLLSLREKGRIIAPCMRMIYPSDIYANFDKWVIDIGKRKQ